PVEVAQLLAPADEEPLLSDQHLANYERALQSFLQGNWPLAHKLLHDMPADDRVPDFLTGFIVQNDRVAPSNWEGVIPLADK
ncbi:MAG: adenylate/guanylate cyclase domain-containing protein, partial [Planctomycetota bacterium]